MRIGQRVKVEKFEVQDKAHICDLCKEAIPASRSWDRDERTLTYAEGAIYPEGDMRTHHKLDVCGECFHEKLVPLLKREFGATFTEYDRDLYFDKVEEPPA